MPTASAGGSFLPDADYVSRGTMASRKPVRVVNTNGPLFQPGVLITGQIIRLTHPAAAAVSLRAPTAAEEGVELVIASGSAFAHVLTATALIQNGVTGGPFTTATFGAFVGATIRLIALAKTWTLGGAPAVVVIT